MNELEQKLSQLINSACKYPTQSPQRQQKIGQIYQLVMKSKKLWREQTDYYDDALQDTWEYFSLNLDRYSPSIEMLCQLFKKVENFQDLAKISEIVTNSGWNWKDKTIEIKWDFLGNSQNLKDNSHLNKAIVWTEELDEKLARFETQKQQQDSFYYPPQYYKLRNYKRIIIWLSVNTWLNSEYQPSLKSLIVWLDDLLKKRLQNYYKKSTKKQNRQINLAQTNSQQTSDLIDRLSAPIDIEPTLNIWQATIDWVNRDPQDILKNIYFRKYPEINAQVLILKKLPPNNLKWDTIAKQWNLSPSESKDLPKFYSRHCRPLLRQFGIDRGYI